MPTVFLCFLIPTRRKKKHCQGRSLERHVFNLYYVFELWQKRALPFPYLDNIETSLKNQKSQKTL
ncbi:MAG: hypothetical protein J6C29_00790, partial [Clostridia bacterium]|nr:hypothetical protein [Clostridia bacterium]